jgi:hypothetical protein
VSHAHLEEKQVSRNDTRLETKEKHVPTNRFAETHTRPTDPGRAGPIKTLLIRATSMYVDRFS